MSLTCTIRRRDKGRLGSADEVKQQLTQVFAGCVFILQEREPPGAAEVRRHMSMLLRVWLAIFALRERYPHWIGSYEAPAGQASVEFYFEPKEPIRWIRATSYGRNAGMDGNFERLARATGWTVVFPRF